MEDITKAALLAAAEKPLEVEPVDVPELGGRLYIRALSGTERDEWERSLVRISGAKNNPTITPATDNVRARFLVRVLCDKDGVPSFTEVERAAAAKAIGKLSSAIVAPLYEKAQRLSKMTKEDLEELGKVSAPEDGTDSSSSSA